jgi:hypothetical protein
VQLPIPELHAPEPDHARVQTQRLAHLVLHGAVGVVAHDEVVSLVVDGLVLRGALRERRDAPVRDAADRAAVLEDEGTGRADDAAEGLVRERGVGGWGLVWGGRTL